MSFNPKVAKTVRAVMLIGLVVVVGLIACWAWVFWRLATPLRTAPISFFWNGVLLFSPEGPTKEYTLPLPPGGDPESLVMLAANSGNVAYCLGDAKAIARIRPDGTLRWYPFPKKMLKPGWGVDGIQAVGDRHVLINLLNVQYHPAGVIALDTATGDFTQLSEAIEARADSRPGSDQLALRKPDGTVFIRSMSDGRESRLAALPDELLKQPKPFDDWTVDFAGKTLFCNVGKKVTAYNPSTNQSQQVTLPWKYSGGGIAWHAASAELWVSVRGALMSDGVAVFNHDLTYQGSYDVGHIPPDPHPVPATRELIDLLSLAALKIEPVPELSR